MVTHVIDYAFARPNPAAIKAAGYTGVLRYVCPVNSQTVGKIITKAEADAIRAAGLDLTLNFEWYETRPTKGYAAGVEDAHTADAQADAIGYPPGCAIYFSVDFGATWPAVSEYFRGVKAASRRPVGVYAGVGIWQHARDAGYAAYGWITNAASWSGLTSWSQIPDAAAAHGAHLYQHLHNNTPFLVAGSANTDFDPNTVLAADYGQWPIQPLGALMALTDTQQAELYDRVTWLYTLIFGGKGQGPDGTQSMIHDIETLERDTQALVRQVIAQPHPNAATIAKAVVAALPPGQGGTIDEAALATAVADELEKRLAS